MPPEYACFPENGIFTLIPSHNIGVILLYSTPHAFGALFRKTPDGQSPWRCILTETRLSKIHFGLIGRHEKGPPPESTGQKKTGCMQDKIGHQVIPSVATSPEMGTTSIPITQFFRSCHGCVPLAAGLQNRLEDPLVKAVQEELVFDLSVVLVAGSGVQLAEKGECREK